MMHSWLFLEQVLLPERWIHSTQVQGAASCSTTSTLFWQLLVAVNILEVKKG